MRILALLVILSFLAMPAPAQERAVLPVIAPEGPPLQALSTAEANRRWEAVGRLDLGIGFCTGTLIAADLVLTAAHCLFDPRSGASLPLAELRFNAGLRNGRPAAQRTVIRAAVYPGYSPTDPDNLNRVGHDMALVELDRPIQSGSIAPVPARGGVVPGDLVQVVSYGADRENVASLEEGCVVLAGDPGVLVLSCHVDPGTSGAPILLDRAGRLSVVSVVSARATWQGEAVALTADLNGRLGTLLDQLGRSDDVFARDAPRVRTLGASDDGRASLGARFLRP